MLPPLGKTHATLGKLLSEKNLRREGVCSCVFETTEWKEAKSMYRQGHLETREYLLRVLMQDLMGTPCSCKCAPTIVQHSVTRACTAKIDMSMYPVSCGQQGF